MTTGRMTWAGAFRTPSEGKAIKEYTAEEWAAWRAETEPAFASVEEAEAAGFKGGHAIFAVNCFRVPKGTRERRLKAQSQAAGRSQAPGNA